VRNSLRLLFETMLIPAIPGEAVITQPQQQYKLRVNVPITFSAFIPDNNIDAPPSFVTYAYCDFNPCIYQGDNRDFTPTGTTYRVRQQITLVPADPAQPLGFLAGTTANLVQPSALYDKLTSIGLDGNLTQEALADTVLGDTVLKIAVGTAGTSSMNVATTRAAPRAMQVELSGNVTNPIPFFACNITWDLTVIADGTSKSSPIYEISGKRGEYPAYDMSIGVQYLQLYDPRPLGRTGFSLCAPTEPISQSGALQ